MAGPHIGAIALVALVLAGQAGGAVLLEHFGLLGCPLKSISFSCILDLGLIGVDVYLARRF